MTWGVKETAWIPYAELVKTLGEARNVDIVLDDGNEGT